MPDLTGWQFASAEAALKKVGIKTAAPSFVNVPMAPVGGGDAKPNLAERPGQVLAQSPSAGTRVDQSTIVKLTVVK
jgi:beta-lactam-binding protein with PASTA domain